MFYAIAFCIIAGTAYADGTDCPAPVVLTPCQYEDSTTCYWDAQRMGNGTGQSFIDVDGITYEWDGTAY